MFSKFLNPSDPSLDRQRLFNISSGKAASEAVQDYLINIEGTGEKLREQFILECAESADRFEKPITKVKIMNFSSEIVKKTVKSGNKVQEIKMQRDLFGRMLGLSMDYDIDFERILCYPITPIPMSMCRLDGSIYQTEKSAIVKFFEKQHHCDNIPKNFDIVIFDGFFLLHTMHDIPSTFGSISKKIMSILTATGAPRVDIIFDQYFTPSIKDYERARRNEQSTIDFNITGSSQTRPTDFMKELKNIKFKQSFVKYLIEHWASSEILSFMGNTSINLNYDFCYSYTVRNNTIEMTINEDMSCNNHEEADTKIVHHVCKVDADFTTNVLIKACDTDVLIIMLGNMDHLQRDTLKIYMEYGTGNARRYISITELYRELGQSLCASLPGFHALTGCDYNPSFFLKGKVRPLKILMKNENYQTALTNIGIAHITGLRHEIFEILEKFVCEIYGFKNITDINTARFQKFCESYKADRKEPFKNFLKNCDPSTLPPCKAELDQHFLRTQYITSIWRNAYKRFPSSLKPDRNGWQQKSNTLQFYWFHGDCLPQLVIDAIVDKQSDNTGEDVTDIAKEAEEEEEEEEYSSSDEESSEEATHSDDE